MYRTVVVATFNDFIINQKAAPAEHNGGKEIMWKTFHVGSKEREISFSFRARDVRVQAGGIHHSLQFRTRLWLESSVERKFDIQVGWQISNRFSALSSRCLLIQQALLRRKVKWKWSSEFIRNSPLKKYCDSHLPSLSLPINFLQESCDLNTRCNSMHLN